MTDTPISPIENPKSPKKNNTLKYLIFIGLLLALNIYMYFSNSKKNSQIETVTEEKRQLDSSFTQLKRDYQKSLAEIEQYKGENAALDSLVAVKQYALENKKNELQKYINQKNITEEDLAKAKKLLQEMKAEVETYKAQIAELTAKYNALNQKYDTLSNNLSTQQATNKLLEDQNSVLSQKVALGSLFRINNLIGTGVKGTGNKEKETSKVNHLEALKISFDVGENKVVDAGEQMIYVRIIDPQGTTIQVESQGSGTITLKDPAKEVPYTMKASFMYANKLKTVSCYWKPSARLAKGIYKVELFQDGYLIAKNEFKLSSGLF